MVPDIWVVLSLYPTFSIKVTNSGHTLKTLQESHVSRGSDHGSGLKCGQQARRFTALVSEKTTDFSHATLKITG